MDIVKAYTTDTLERTLAKLDAAGFRKNRKQDYLFEYLLPIDWIEEYQHPLERRSTDSFLVLPEPVVNIVEQDGIVVTYPAEYFSYRDVMRYHNITHALPVTMVAADYTAIEKFVQRSQQGGLNPFYNLLRSLSDVVVLNRQKELTWHKFPNR